VGGGGGHWAPWSFESSSTAEGKDNGGGAEVWRLCARGEGRGEGGAASWTGTEGVGWKGGIACSCGDCGVYVNNG